MNTKILLLILTVFTFIFISYAKAETQTFYDNFESGIDNWDLQSGWSVALEDGNHILQGTQHTFAMAYVSGVVNKLELKLKLLEGGIHLNIRDKTEGRDRYFIGFYEGNSYVQKEQVQDFQQFTSGAGISINEWHRVKIEIIQNTINVYVDEELVLSAQDPDILTEGDISFETFENSRAYIDDVKVETSVPEARELKAQDIFPNGQHKGDLTLEGRDFLILENGNFEQFGNIYLKDSSKLIIRDSTFQITRYQRLLNHWGIRLQDTSSLEINNSRLIPGDGTLFVVDAQGRSRVVMKDSPTKIHLFTIRNNAKGDVENSEIVFDIGGLVSAFDKGTVKVKNSKIGAVNLYIPPNTTLIAEGLGTGFYKNWELQKNLTVSGIDYNIILENTELVPDKLGPGPYERGFPVFIDSSAKVKIKNSELRKVVITVNNEKAEFSNFYLEKPSNLKYRGIELENVIVKGQWGIFLHGSSDVVVRDSDAFWTFIYDDSKLTLINTHMNEFDPRNFRGEMLFENSRWDTAAEIIENNDFVMKGSLEIWEIGGFSWENSSVTRIYEVIEKPNTELYLTKDGKNIWTGRTDEKGKATFSLRFDDTTFDDSWLLKDSLGHEIEVTFFSKTPINIEQNIISKLIQKIKVMLPSAPPEPVRAVLSVPILIIATIVAFFLWKKYSKKKK